MTSVTTKRRSRKATAVVAATAVLGVATVATLASWTITEFVSGQFATADQNPTGSIEASADGITFDQHAALGSGLSVVWDKDVTRLAGNENIAAPYYIRTTAGTTANIRINVTSAATNDNGLTYTVFAVDNTAVCDANINAGSQGVIQNLGTAALTADLSNTFSLPGATAQAPGTAQKLCIKVNVPDTAAANTTTNVDFGFVAQK